MLRLMANKPAHMRPRVRQVLENEVMTSDQLAEALGIQKNSIRQRIHRGTLKGVKVGSIWLFDRVILDQLAPPDAA